MKLKRFDGKPTLGSMADIKIPKPPQLQAKCDALRDWINLNLQRPAGLAEQDGVSMVDVWSMGHHAGFTDADQDELMDWFMTKIDAQIMAYRDLQEGRAHAVKYTSSGHANWWERARIHLEQ